MSEQINETSESIFAWACAVLGQKNKRASTHISKLGEELSELQREINKCYILRQINEGDISVQKHADDPKLYTDAEYLAEQMNINNAAMEKEVSDVFIVLANLAESQGVHVKFTNTAVQNGLFEAIEIFDELSSCFEVFGKLSFNCAMYDFGDTYQSKTWIHDYLVKFNNHLRFLASALDINIQAGVDNKMGINRKRTWNIGVDGTGSHVK